MRPIHVLATAAATLALAVTAGTAAAAPTATAPGVVPLAKLALMPLSLADIGPSAAGLAVQPSSGRYANDAAVEDDDFGIVPKQVLAGRATGYRLHYDDPTGGRFRQSEALYDVRFGIGAYRTAAGAERGVDVEVATYRGAAGVDLGAFDVGVTASQVRPGAAEVAMSVKAPGFPRQWAVLVVMPVGTLALSVEASGSSRALVQREVRRLAGLFVQRAEDVLAGAKITQPARIPARPKAARNGGPDLARLTVAPGDLGEGSVEKQGYEVPDETALAEYERSIDLGGEGGYEANTTVYRGEAQAAFVAGAGAVLLGSARFYEAFGIAQSIGATSIRTTKLPALRAGDFATSSLLSFRIGDQTVHQLIVIIQRGPVLASVARFSSGALPTAADARRIADAMAARLAAG